MEKNIHVKSSFQFTFSVFHNARQVRTKKNIFSIRQEYRVIRRALRGNRVVNVIIAHFPLFYVITTKQCAVMTTKI